MCNTFNEVQGLLERPLVLWSFFFFFFPTVLCSSLILFEHTRHFYIMVLALKSTLSLEFSVLASSCNSSFWWNVITRSLPWLLYFKGEPPATVPSFPILIYILCSAVTSWYYKYLCTCIDCASLMTQIVKVLPAVWEARVQSLGWEDVPENRMATHSNILAWRIPWTEESGGIQSTGSQRVGHNWVPDTSTFFQSA